LLVFVVYMGQGVMGVVYAKTISLGLSGLMGFFFFRNIRLEPTPVDWKPVIRFGGFSFLLGIVKRLSTQVLLVFMGLLVAPVQLGFFYLIQKISTTLIDMPVSALNTVLLPAAAERHTDIQQQERFISLSVKLYVVLSIALALLFVLIGPLLVVFFFPEFAPSITLIPLFALYFAFTFDVPLTTFYRAIQRNEVLVTTNVIILAVTVVLGFWAIQSFGVEGVVGLMVVTRAVQLVYICWDLKKNNHQIGFWPKMADMRFFWSLLTTAIKKELPDRKEPSRPSN